MIRMKHPLHGFHLANGQEEVEMRKNGWVEDVPELAEPLPAPPSVEVKEKRPHARKANK